MPNQDTRIVASTQVLTIDNVKFVVYGSEINYDNRGFTCYNANSNIEVHYGNIYKKGIALKVEDKVEIDQNKNNTQYTVNGVSYSLLWSETTFTTPYTLALFALHRGTKASSFGNIRMFSFQIYDDEILIRSYVPCYNKELEQYGLYDTVTEEFYGNSGTGKFYGKSFLEEGETCKVFDYEQYFVDHEMIGDISTTTIAGTGTEKDPYILNSSEDFWWATNYIKFTDKFVELGCDIILNEEKFDADGNVIAGTSVDGRVYKWKSIGDKTLKFNGNGFGIFGAYYISSSRYRGLFSDADVVSNLLIADSYFQSNGYSGIFCCFANKIINCKSQNCKTTTYESFVYSCPYVENCENYNDLRYGMVYYGGEVINCKNYGNNSGWNSSGIAFSANRVVNCVNYGRTEHGIAYQAKEIRDCANYGNASCGMSRNCRLIINCINEGEIDPSTPWNNCLFGPGKIINCRAKTKNNIRFTTRTIDTDVEIRNCTLEIENFRNNAPLFSSYDFYGGQNVVIENVKIIAKGASSRRVKMKDGLYQSGYSSFNMKNVLLITNFEITNSNDLFNKKTKYTKETIDGVVISAPTQKLYYGSNFSGFNISWKTGEISLNSMSSVGCFAPRLTEANLIGMGFQKTVI